MFNSVAFDVVIGLVFIYLLYSLLATVLSELIASSLGLRARNLREAIDRMLNDEKKTCFLCRVWDTFMLLKNPENPIVNAFYNHPEIKYLGSSGVFSSPASFKSSSFSKTLMSLMFGNEPLKRQQVDTRLKRIVETAGNTSPDEQLEKLFDKDTAVFIQSIWYESDGDIANFKLKLEAWFDRTMEQTTVWYKRKIRFVLLVLGFLMAWFFYADTFVIVRNLSTDKAAREQLVSMANAYVQNNKLLVDTTKIKDSAEMQSFNARLDSLLLIKKQLDADISKANSLLGMGGWPPDTVVVNTNAKTSEKSYTPKIDAALLSNADKQVSNGKIAFTFGEKLRYLFRLLGQHFWGFLITAIAISLGAPFWFDLLNKLMQLRTSKKEETSSVNNTDSNIQSITVKSNTRTSEEAVG